MLIASLLPPAPVTISHQGLPQEPVHTVIRHLPKVSAPDHVAAPNHPHPVTDERYLKLDEFVKPIPIKMYYMV